jgi:hypothetical protein
MHRVMGSLGSSSNPYEVAVTMKRELLGSRVTPFAAARTSGPVKIDL